MTTTPAGAGQKYMLTWFEYSLIDRILIPKKQESTYWIPRLNTKTPTPINVYRTVFNIVAGNTLRIIVGLPTARSEERLAIIVGYTLNIMSVSMDLRGAAFIYR